MSAYLSLKINCNILIINILIIKVFLYCYILSFCIFSVNETKQGEITNRWITLALVCANA